MKPIGHVIAQENFRLMCSIILLRRPGHPHWPLLIAANRDELSTRPARPPARHWPDRAEVVAGLDELAGGSWLGLSDHGLVAAVLDRPGTLGPAAGKRSRGDLVLEALDHAEASLAARALRDLDPAAYRPFNLVIADETEAFWLRHAGDRLIGMQALPEGISMLAGGELGDMSSPRIRRYLPLFREATPPTPETGDWSSWQLLLAATASETGDPRDALCIITGGAYGTQSSSLIALPASPVEKAVWLYADGRPTDTAYVPVDLD